MDLLIQAIVIGIVQGLTEFLPISSSAHLILLPPLLGWDDALINSPAFVVMLHMGSLAALLVYFWRDLWRYALAGLAVLRDRRIGADPDRRMAVLLAASVIPAAIVGVLLEDFIDTFFRERLLAVTGLLILGALILFVAERAARHTRAMHELRLRDALAIGVAQALALFPGISRSGITISAGLMLGLERPAAARFAFLMGTPIIAGAGIWKMRQLLDGTLVFDPAVLAGGMISSALASLAAIAVLLAFLRRYSTDVFVAYRVVFALGVGALLFARGTI
ncbi:MAG TPA: undecaprenyl-diphosphatase UppP [Candidatus Limnocylindria bacterium]|jgi:undecaprenyl-diphosphatase|nr:undecaprenyl-diphosphatase UppP [Candidatus Limnocylindria bacterium]